MQTNQQRINNETVPGKIVYKTATATLKPYERTVVVTAAAAATITLPPVMQCQGLTFVIKATNGAAHTTTVEDHDGDAGFADVALDADAEYVGVYSDGLTWHEVITGYS
jgi:hypothetical protein